jgi:hypothetical protein
MTGQVHVSVEPGHERKQLKEMGEARRREAGVRHGRGGPAGTAMRVTRRSRSPVRRRVA